MAGVRSLAVLPRLAALALSGCPLLGEAAVAGLADLTGDQKK
jgi:hypothetical protein